MSTCMPRTSAPNSREPSAYLTNACLNRFPALLDVTCESGVRRRAGEHVHAGAAPHSSPRGQLDETRASSAPHSSPRGQLDETRASSAPHSSPRGPLDETRASCGRCSRGSRSESGNPWAISGNQWQSVAIRGQSVAITLMREVPRCSRCFRSESGKHASAELP